MYNSYTFLFVNYSGYPEYMEYLYMENGLSYLCSLLKKNGHKCIILDYVTLSIAERLYPSEYMTDITKLRGIALNNIIKYKSIPSDLLKEISELEGLIDERNRRVVDEILKEIISYIREMRVDCVGFKLWSQPSLKDTFYMVKEIRRTFPKLLIVGGGPHVDFFKENIYEDTGDIFDFLVYGDGEIAVNLIPKYLDGLITLEEIPNIVYKKNGKIISNPEQRVEKLAYDVNVDFDEDTYWGINKLDEKVRLIPLENARGCNFNCGFCIHPIKSGRYREKDPEAFIEEVYFLKERYGFINFYAVGSNTSHKNCIENLKKVYERGNEVILSFFQSTRDFDLSNEFFLKDANVGFFWIGVETSSQKINQSVIINGKQVSKVEAVCLLLKQLGIRAYTSYIYPLPGSNEELADETLKMMQKLNSEWVVIYPPLIQPRTPWFRGTSKHIKFVDKKAFVFASMYGIDEIENKVLPRIITDDVLAESVLINGKTYREIYYEYLIFKNRYNSDNPVFAHEYTIKELDLSLRRNWLYSITDKMTNSVMRALTHGEFDRARKDLKSYNLFCTSGSLLKN